MIYGKMMKRSLVRMTSLLCLIALITQGSKDARKNRIKSVLETCSKGDKTINEKKTIYDLNGDVIEETDYNKEGQLKETVKSKRNQDGKVVEELTYNAKGELSEKKVNQFDKYGEKTEEDFYDSKNILTKKHKFLYDKKGLKTERQVYDGSGKLTEVKRYIYEYYK